MSALSIGVWNCNKARFMVLNTGVLPKANGLFV